MPGIHIPDGVRGVYGTSFVRPEDQDKPCSERPQTDEIRIESGTPLILLLGLLNHSPEPETFLVTIVLDYRQVEFELDGKPGLLHQVTVPPWTDLEIPFHLDVGKLGAHDLFLIAFRDPYNCTVDEDFRMNLGGHINGSRAVIIVGSSERPTRTLEPDVVGAPPPPDVTTGFGVLFADVTTMRDSHPFHRQLYVAEAIAGEAYPLQAWVSNCEGHAPLDYGIVAFLNFHQVGISGQEVLIVHAEAGEEAILDIELDVPEEPGLHQYQWIWVTDPYRSILHREVASPFVHASPRIAIVAR